MAKDHPSWDGVAKTVVMCVSLVFGTGSIAFALSRASPAEIKQVQNSINDVSHRVVAVEENLKHLADLLGRIEEQAVLFNENSKEWFRMMHEHD